MISGIRKKNSALQLSPESSNIRVLFTESTFEHNTQNHIKIFFRNFHNSQTKFQSYHRLNLRTTLGCTVLRESTAPEVVFILIMSAQSGFILQRQKSSPHYHDDGAGQKLFYECTRVKFSFICLHPTTTSLSILYSHNCQEKVYVKADKSTAKHYVGFGYLSQWFYLKSLKKLIPSRLREGF